MARADFEKLRVYRMAEELADLVWGVCRGWSTFERDTVGKQLVRSVDGIGANIAEGSGRYHYKENRRFVRIARGSLYEATHWLRRAYRRKLLSSEQSKRIKALVEELSPSLNAYLTAIGRQETRAARGGRSTNSK